jgi:hypothetical protein
MMLVKIALLIEQLVHIFFAQRQPTNFLTYTFRKQGRKAI